MRSVFTWRRARSFALALAAAGALALAGCSDDSDDEGRQSAGQDVNLVQGGAPGEPSRRITQEELERMESPRHTPADVDFMQGMIHHHAQALVMTSMVRDRSASESLTILARRIELAQEAEIETMERWLTARDEDVPTAEDHENDHGGGGNLMPGMVGHEKLARLAAADGRAFDRMFLEYMIRHHQGALTMVRQLYEENGGIEAEIGLFTRHVESDQSIEINRMAGLLTEVDELPAKTEASKIGPRRPAHLAFAGGRPLICVLP
jgi:uncharacterized protein (DUF305 family)